ncbi:MAG: hypothetical protein CMJ89_15970 [Planctomycetes bacterium]|nr:hypothetical protein [Planctomycetota bacterium]
MSGLLGGDRVPHRCGQRRKLDTAALSDARTSGGSNRLPPHARRRPFFQDPLKLSERTWKGVLILGLVLGVALYAVQRGELYVTTVQPWRLCVGGLFVGYGTRLSCGCTSGHAICGVSAASPPSLASTGAFTAAAVAAPALASGAGRSLRTAPACGDPRQHQRSLSLRSRLGFVGCLPGGRDRKLRGR